MVRHFKQGQGWRLGWDPEASDFQALLGGDTWAVELTGPEFAEFKRLLLQLLASLEQITLELMEEETITCDASSDLLWVQLQGYPHRFDLNFILLRGRRAEGGWPAAVTLELIQAIQMESGF